jgi:SAM-dependent methyltransferase
VAEEKTWREIWEARTLDPARPSVLAQLMAADGLDTSFAHVDEAAWRGFTGRIGQALGITPATSIFEVGCGAGAFLYPFHESGCTVGGLDASRALVEIARQVMPGALLANDEAAALDTDEKWDVVLSMGVFLYFPSLDYAREVLARMAKKARRFVAVLDVADAARRDQALAMRRGHLTPAEYDQRYRGLDHLYVPRDWMKDTLTSLGLHDVEISDQQIPGYPNGPFRFNAWGRV